jgi:glutamate dehydrogenase (NADP+)
MRKTVIPTAIRSLSSTGGKQNLLTHEEGVHQTMKVSKSWRTKPLFRRQGDVRFKTGLEASNLLIREAQRRDSHEAEYIDAVTATMQTLSPIFDRNPKYAFAAKTLMEPERFIQFRVAWIDDLGVNRLNRGYRVQYSSALGPYSGSLHFGLHVTTSVIHSIGFDTIFSNALTGMGHGAAVGGADFNPIDKSESELQRFCQSYMTELAKYVGVDQDIPWMGKGVGPEEMGYMYGQYKRISGRSGKGELLSSALQKVSQYDVMFAAVTCPKWSFVHCLPMGLFPCLSTFRPRAMELFTLPTKCFATRRIRSRERGS